MHALSQSVPQDNEDAVPTMQAMLVAKKRIGSQVSPPPRTDQWPGTLMHHGALKGGGSARLSSLTALETGAWYVLPAQLLSAIYCGVGHAVYPQVLQSLVSRRGSFTLAPQETRQRKTARRSEESTRAASSLLQQRLSCFEMAT